MKKKMKSGYMQPSKELKFGGPSKQKMAAGGIKKTTKNGKPALALPDGRVVTEGGPGYAGALRKYNQDNPAKEAPSAREKKQNTPQGTGANRTGKSGSNTDSKRVNQKLDELSNMPGPAKKSTYADAKKKDPKLDSYIKIRNNSKKGSPEYTSAQNKINKAYGRGPQRKVAPMKTVKAQKAKPIDSGVKSPGLQTKKSAPAPKPKSTPKPNTGGGSGMGGVQAEKDKIADLKSTPAPTATPDRRAKRKGRQAARRTKREAIKDAKSNLKAARKMTAGGMKTPSADQKGLQKLPTAVRNKMGYKRAGGKKKALLGGMMGAIGGAKAAGGGLGKKLLGAAKGALGGGLVGRGIGAIKGAMGGGGLQGAVQGFKGGALGNSNPMGGGGGAAADAAAQDPNAAVAQGGGIKSALRGYRRHRARVKSGKSNKNNPRGGSKKVAHTRGMRRPATGSVTFKHGGVKDRRKKYGGKKK